MSVQDSEVRRVRYLLGSHSASYDTRFRSDPALIGDPSVLTGVDPDDVRRPGPVSVGSCSPILGWA